jgi:site-specific DNA-methyltransferase (adenine-specific)
MTRKSYRNSRYEIHNADSFEWLRKQRANSFHAVVTDPPFGIVEYTAKELGKRRNGRGIWRLPNSFDGAKRQPMPRFTVLDHHDHMGVLAFHYQLAPELFRVLVPGAHVMIASQCLVSHLVAQAFCMAGFEARGQIVRIVKTLRGGDRPKFAETKFKEVSVIPRSSYEPWLLFKKPHDGRVAENLKRYGTGALRRPAKDVPFSDTVEVPPARKKERALGNHPSIKPQALMRHLVRASLPLSKGVLLDPFMGSGSTIAAATHLKLKSVGVEVDPYYFRLARRAIPKLSHFFSGADQDQNQKGIRRARSRKKKPRKRRRRPGR